jgi:hypothetical protein
VRLATAVIGISLAAAPAAHAQRLAPAPFPSIDEPRAAVHQYLPPAMGNDGGTGSDGVGMVFLGVVGGLAGAVVGSSVGGSCAELACEPGAIYGFVIGEALGVATGVHLANDSRGNLGQSVLATLAIGGGGIAAAALSDRGVVLLAVPVLQIAAAIGIERRADRGDQDPI